jgi:DNA gyrase inhibitor GyrI
MGEIDVRIVELEPMRVASVYGFGASPEEQAWGKLMNWSKPKGLLQNPEQHRIFGFNNPNPSAGSPNYGYEFWIAVGPEAEPEGEVRILDFSGGLYAVTRCELAGKGPGEIIPATWKQLVEWLGKSKYKHAKHQWLEEHFVALDKPEEITHLDLYAPIAE